MSTTTQTISPGTGPAGTHGRATGAHAADPDRARDLARTLHAADARGRRASRSPGVAQLVRPATASSPEFLLAYARQGPRMGTLPVLVVPGGPGVASILPYRTLRTRAAQDGLDVLMVEHRGVGLSRLDVDGAALPPSAVTLAAVVDDLLAVLDHEGIDRVVLLGSGSGSYLAAALVAAHPDRVAGLVLDSPLLGGRDHRAVREQAATLLWEGHCPQIARLLHSVVDQGTCPAEATAVARAAYERGGPRLVQRLLEQHVAGRAPRTWDWLATRHAVAPARHPYLREPDVLAHPGPADPLFDPVAALAQADRATVILTGDQDLRSPSRGAEELAARIPGAVLAHLPGTGHSALDSHQFAALEAVHALRDLELDVVADRIATLRRTGRGRRMRVLVGGALLLDRLLTPPGG